jgi:cytochrome c peroxidase
MTVARAVALALSAILICGCAAQPGDSAPSFTELERNIILTLSPLGAPPRDSTNRVDGSAGAIRFGKRLFFDPRLSGNGRIACATCHDPAHGWADGRSIAVGAATGTRNTPSLWNAAHNRWFFWDGRADSLWSQALKPIEDNVEMNGSRLAVAHLLAGDGDLRSGYEAVFGPLPFLHDAERFPPAGGPLAGDGARQAEWWRMDAADRQAVSRVFANVGKAIAAYVATVTTAPAPFDRFVDDLRAGRAGSRAISAAAQRGLRIFVGRGSCVLCHSGPTFTNKEFHDVRVPVLAADAPPDAGRLQGVLRLLEDEFVAVGTHSDDAESARAQQMLYVNDAAGSLGHFKTPGLRNVALTAPYMHQGQLATLDAVVKHYSTLETAAAPADPSHIEALIRPLGLTDREIGEVVAFLESLSSE